jgi:hypothetical protein
MAQAPAGSALLTSPEVRKFIEDTHMGSVLPATSG